MKYDRMQKRNPRELIADEVHRLMPTLWDIALYLHEHPEQSGEEFQAQRLLVDFLQDQGFTCSLGVAELPTSFVAWSGPPRRPAVAFIAEYDALPGLGHGCGHNLIAASAVGAACALTNTVPKLRGQVAVVGTPAEESPKRCAKRKMLEAGVFAEIDVALMMHPSDRTTTMGRSLAMDSVLFRFKGKPAHASKYPYLGVSALDAAVLTFIAIEFLREHVRPDVRIHGIIIEGGLRPNIVPETAILEYMIRAEERFYLNQIRERIINCARAGALATGAEVEVLYEKGPDNKLLVPTLNTLLLEEAIKAGADQVMEPEEERGSTDFGDVSQHLPAATLKVAFVPPGCPGHSYEWVEAAKGERAKHAVRVASQAMAVTGYWLLTEEDLLAQVVGEFRKLKSAGTSR